MKHYRSLYPNHVHQLSVSVSKHYYAGADKLLKYQNKAFDINLNNAAKTSKDHLIVYSLRDHMSGLYYVELAFLSNLLPIRDFLYNAWSNKETVKFSGLPEIMLIPKTVEKIFPDMINRVLSQNIELVPVSSGFQSGGLIAMKAVENHLVFYIKQPISELNKAALEIYHYNAKSMMRGHTNDVTKEDCWIQSVPNLRFPSNDF